VVGCTVDYMEERMVGCTVCWMTEWLDVRMNLYVGIPIRTAHKTNYCVTDSIEQSS
jgi:hypothetical protein